MINKINKLFREIADNHKLINSFASGESFEKLNKLDNRYPQLFLLEPYNKILNYQSHTNSYSISLEILELPDNANQTEILNLQTKCEEIGQSILEYIDLKINELNITTVNVISFKNRYNGICGCSFDFELSLPMSGNLCDQYIDKDISYGENC